MKKKIIVIFLIANYIFIIQACKKDKSNTEADNALYSEATSGTYTYYQNGTLLSAVSPSPHGSFKLKFNATALAALDSTGELPQGNSFPTGSIIVKEVHSGSSVNLYAVMKKDPSNSNASNGWLWAEYNTDGTAAFSIDKNGDGCTSCHSGTPNRDFTRTFDLH